MGIIGSMILLIIGAYLFIFLLIKIIGSMQKESNSTDEAISRDNDEFNPFT